MILTAKQGTNADLFPDVLAIYVPEGSRVLDMTWGKGVFWQKVDVHKYSLMRNDMYTSPVELNADLRSIPLHDACFDAVVLDPPYAAHGTAMKSSIDNCYQGKSVPEMSCAGVMDLYEQGIRQAHRLLVPGGVLILKVQDEIESGKQKWKHADLLKIDGFVCEDLFVLVQNGVPAQRWPHQLHARKNHSYFLVHRKLKESK